MIQRLKTARTLGLAQSGWYALYRFGLSSGHYRRSTPSRREQAALRLRTLWPLPERDRLEGLLDEPARAALLEEVEEIIAGKVRLFGGPPVPLMLEPPGPQAHWTEYELGQVPGGWGVEDVKLIWEPARFGWVFSLGRAYRLNGDERCAVSFWRFFEIFDRANPPNLGPNWTSAQEVALRLAAFIFAAAVFADSPESTPARLERLAQSVAEHAARIPITLPYARAQHNNHLVSEGLGLYAAGLALADHPRAAAWREQGWRELNRALQSQIDIDGTYCQHSTNYHRLMLQAALLADALARVEGREWPGETVSQLYAAVGWLYQQIDLLSGQVPNLGHNDGAHILPLASGGYADYRPTLQAAARAFAGGGLLEPGVWDEYGLWLGLPKPESGAVLELLAIEEIATPRLSSADGTGWASLRVVHYTSRPAHADPLHVEIWQDGINLALDAGTHRYSAPPPWENALVSAVVHNTLTVDGQEPMTRAGKFLWLDWVKSTRLKEDDDFIEAQQDGYRKLGVLHRRRLARTAEGWLVTDNLLPAPGLPSQTTHAFTMHWLLPDWPFTLEGENAARLDGPEMGLRVKFAGAVEGTLQVIRAGEVLAGEGADQPAKIFGWQSPTYNVRLPALSLRWTVRSSLPLELATTLLIYP